MKTNIFTSILLRIIFHLGTMFHLYYISFFFYLFYILIAVDMPL